MTSQHIGRSGWLLQDAILEVIGGDGFSIGVIMASDAVSDASGQGEGEVAGCWTQVPLGLDTFLAIGPIVCPCASVGLQVSLPLPPQRAVRIPEPLASRLVTRAVPSSIVPLSSSSYSHASLNS